MSTTRHATDCQRVFSRYDPTCPRCCELAAGAAPRPGCGRSEPGPTRAEIRAHDCRARGCGPICTFGQW